MLSELTKKKLIGGYLSGDADFDTQLVHSLLDETDGNMYPECLSLYNSNEKVPLLEQMFFESKYTKSFQDRYLEIAQNLVLNNSITLSDAVEARECAEHVIDVITSEKGPKSFMAIRKETSQPEIIKSGLDYVDDVVGPSGFEVGRSYVFAAYLKDGKSTTLRNIALNLAINNPDKKVVLLSLEDDEKDFNASLNDGFNYKLFEEKFTANNNFSFEYNPNVTTEYVNQLAKNFDIIVLDYLSNMASLKSYTNTYDKLGDFAMTLHTIAKKNNILLITAAQLSKTSIGLFREKDEIDAFKDLDASDLADSQGIARNSDAVIIIKKSKTVNGMYFSNVAGRRASKIRWCIIENLKDYRYQLSNKGSTL